MIRILAVVIACLVLALGTTGLLLKWSYEANASLELATKMQQEAIMRLHKAREDDAALVREYSAMNAMLAEDTSRERARLDSFRSTLRSRTLEKPQVTERAARLALRRYACEVWEATGGKGECPKR